MDILPVNPKWIHSFVLESYLQGATLLEFAWTGQDQSIIPIKFTWGERVVLWLQGFSLMIPIISNIIWLAWQTFGNPELLVDPHSPEIVRSPTPPLPVDQNQAPRAKADIQEIPAEEQVKPLEQFIFKKYSGGNLENPASAKYWNIHYEPDCIIAIETDKERPSQSSYTYGTDHVLKKLVQINGEQSFQLDILNETKEAKVKFSYADSGYDKTVPLPTDAPVIQHPFLGLKNFVLSENKEIYFYSVFPCKPNSKWFPKWLINKIGEPPLIEKFYAKKGVTKKDGTLVKVESWSARGFPFNLFKAEGWFDTKTGNLVELAIPCFKISGNFDRTGQLPE